MHHEPINVTGGVDTHLNEHVVAAVDAVGRISGTASFPSTSAGYRRLLRWLRGHGRLVRDGVEGTRSPGAGLCRFLTGEQIAVIEVNRPTPSMPRLPRGPH